MTHPARADDTGLCYGVGQAVLEDWIVEVDGIRTARCPECGRRVAIHPESRNRIYKHKPVTGTSYQRRRLYRVAQERQADLARIAARMNVAEWIATERREYSDEKYAEETEARHKLILETQNFGLDGEWMVFIGGYLKRAELLGLDTSAGRQALGKAIVTCLHALETAVQYVGPMPQPGVSSTDGAKEWVHG